MAKKMNHEGTSAPPAGAKRRAPAKKKTAAATASASGNNRPGPTQAEIAEAAYYRHLNRGGIQGDEFSDWLEAERELKDKR
jgi:hypothetical protein